MDEVAKNNRTLWQKLTRKCFPYYAPEWPPHIVNKYVDGIGTVLTIGIRFPDRVRILFSGRIEVQVLTGTENKIGKNESASRFNVLPPK